MAIEQAGYAGYLVLDADLPDRPPLGRTFSYQSALLLLEHLQQQFWDCLDANGEGGGRNILSLVVVGVPPPAQTRPVRSCTGPASTGRGRGPTAGSQLMVRRLPVG